MAQKELMSLDKLLPQYLRKMMDFPYLNRMQSECLETWESDENLVISAPTGAGKTACFELSILRLLHQTLRDSEPKHLRNCNLSGKIVYLAPTKSLCSQKVANWTKRFQAIGLRIESVTGDSYASAISIQKLKQADLLVATPEKWDSITRGVGSMNHSELSNRVKLLLLDEIHQLGETRGASLEAVVTRMLVAQEDVSNQANPGGQRFPVESLRVIAVSATAPNIDDIGLWLRASPEHVKVFNESYRPISLEYHVEGFSAKNPWLYNQVFNREILNIIQKFSDGKPSIVFCTSRKQCIAAAQAVFERLQAIKGKAVPTNCFTEPMSPEKQRKLRSLARECDNSHLSKLLAGGIGYHNSDMGFKTRRLVESLFSDSLLPCLFSTSTLAQGLNLPARLVVIAGTTIYNDGNLQEYENSLLMQMCGRAGRVGMDTKGVVVIMTRKDKVAYYKDIASRGPEKIQSQLAVRIEESVNAEIARGVVSDVPSAIFFLSRTLYWSQRKNYCEKGQHAEERDEDVATLAVSTINTLVKQKLVGYSADMFSISCTTAGLNMARYCLSLQSMELLLEEIPRATSPSQVLRAIVRCPNVVENDCLRREEKKRLKELNEVIRMPVEGRVKDITDKAFLVIQVILGGHTIGKSRNLIESSLRREGHKFLKNAARVSQCILTLCLQHGFNISYEVMTSVLQVARGIQNCCFWDGPTCLRQIPGVTTTHIKMLCKGGYSTLSKVVSAHSRDELQAFVEQQSSLSKAIIDGVESLPTFHVSILTEADEHDNGRITAISVEVNVEKQFSAWWKGTNFFILVGSHSRGLLHCGTFPIQRKKGFVYCDVPEPKGTSTARKWIDVTVGCDGLVGLDSVHRIWENNNNRDARVVGSRCHEVAVASGEMRQHRVSLPTRGTGVKLRQQRLSLEVKPNKKRRITTRKNTPMEQSVLDTHVEHIGNPDSVITKLQKQQANRQKLGENTVQHESDSSFIEKACTGAVHVHRSKKDPGKTTETAASGTARHEAHKRVGGIKKTIETTKEQGQTRDVIKCEHAMQAAGKISENSMCENKRIEVSLAERSAKRVKLSQEGSHNIATAAEQMTTEKAPIVPSNGDDGESSSTVCEYDEIFRVLF